MQVILKLQGISKLKCMPFNSMNINEKIVFPLENPEKVNAKLKQKCFPFRYALLFTSLFGLQLLLSPVLMIVVLMKMEIKFCVYSWYGLVSTLISKNLDNYAEKQTKHYRQHCFTVTSFAQRENVEIPLKLILFLVMKIVALMKCTWWLR